MKKWKWFKRQSNRYLAPPLPKIRDESDRSRWIEEVQLLADENGNEVHPTAVKAQIIQDSGIDRDYLRYIIGAIHSPQTSSDGFDELGRLTYVVSLLLTENVRSKYYLNQERMDDLALKLQALKMELVYATEEGPTTLKYPVEITRVQRDSHRLFIHFRTGAILPRMSTLIRKRWFGPVQKAKGQPGERSTQRKDN